MRRACAAAWAVGLLALVPLAGAQRLSNQLDDVQFNDTVVTLAPNAITIDALDAAITGSTAEDLRECIDGHISCSEPDLADQSPGDGDGQVDADEVDDFESLAVTALNFLGGDFEQWRANLKELVTIDGQGATGLLFESLDLAGAEGSVDSRATITAALSLRVVFDGVDSADTHRIVIQRTRADIQNFKQITVRPGHGWEIEPDSIQPAGMRGKFDADRQRFQGSLNEFMGTEPLTFTLKSTGASDIGWWLLGLSVLMLAGAGYALYAARKARAKG